MPRLVFLTLSCILFTAAVLAQPSGRADVVISAEELASIYGSADVVVLHVAREAAHFEEGHIPAARFLPLSAFAVDRDNRVNLLPAEDALRYSLEGEGISTHSDIVLYGDFGGLSAARAFFALDVHGLPNVRVLDGGRAAWSAAGGGLATGTAAAVEPGSVHLALAGNRVLKAPKVYSAMDDAGTVLVDARPGDQHTGADPGPGIERPGHIPGSLNLFWEDDLDEQGAFLPGDVLRQRYEAAGVTPDRRLIVYCRTGVQASHAYLVARILGLRPYLYDGSYHDWSNNTAYPVSAIE
jgi:thiosulfate/3-mercaptopyruvate sulfurtransferase